MINKKLLSFDPAAMRYVWRCVLCQWLSLLCNVGFVWALAGIVGGALGAGLAASAWPAAFAVCIVSIPLRFVCTTRASAMSDKASAGVKRTLRAKIYQKMLALGTNYSETVATSEAVMLASEGRYLFCAISAAAVLQPAGPADPVCAAGPGASALGAGAAGLRAADPHVHCGGAEVCQKAAEQILGRVHHPGRQFSGKHPGPDDPQNLSGRWLEA